MIVLPAGVGLVRPGSAGAGNTDDFSTNTLASYTEYADNAASYSITGGFLVATATPVNKQSALTRNGVTITNGEVSAVLTRANDAGLVTRLTDNNNYYVAVVRDASSTGTGNRAELYKKVAGTYTQLGSTVLISFTRDTSHTLALSVSGTSIVVKFDGATIISQTDSAHSSGKAGVRTNGGEFKCDSFSWP